MLLFIVFIKHIFVAGLIKFLLIVLLFNLSNKKLTAFKCLLVGCLNISVFFMLTIEFSLTNITFYVLIKKNNKLFIKVPKFKYLSLIINL